MWLASSAAKDGLCVQCGLLLYSVAAESIQARYQYSLETNCVGSSPSICIFFLVGLGVQMNITRDGQILGA